MAMNFRRLSRLYIMALVITSLHLLTQFSLAEIWPGTIASTPKGPSLEEKNRLGSTPPTCHNRCNACNPCVAVQVPTLPAHDGAYPVPRGVGTRPSAIGKKYTNYKPLGWKCRCGNHLFNP